MAFRVEGSGFHIAPRSMSNRMASLPFDTLCPGVWYLGAVTVANPVEVLPPKVPNARLERARATVRSVVWIRAEVEKIGEDVSMSGGCRALQHAREIVRRRWLQLLQNVDIPGKTCLGHRRGVPLRVFDVVHIVKSGPASIADSLRPRSTS